MTMSQKNEGNFKTLPIGRLGIIPLTSCLSLGKKVDNYLVEWRTGRRSAEPHSVCQRALQKCLCYKRPRAVMDGDIVAVPNGRHSVCNALLARFTAGDIKDVRTVKNPAEKRFFGLFANEHDRRNVRALQKRPDAVPNDRPAAKVEQHLVFTALHACAAAGG